MQVGFGFPEGYGPEDAGATFKVYHYKSDGSIEEVPCVVTEYGIIATVSSFSPYAIIAVKSDALPASTTKSTYARTVGLGGDVTVAKNGTTTSGVVTLSEGDKITYTFAPETGYKAERIILNGVETILNGQTSIEYNYSDLKDNNILEVYFVAESVAQKEADEGITPIYASVKMTLPSANKTAKTSTTNGMPAWLYAVIAVAVVFAVAAVVTVIVTKAHKKSRKEN
jgi:hypothetical protein